MDDRQGIRRRDPTSKHLGDAGTPDTQGLPPRMLSPITQNKFYPTQKITISHLSDFFKIANIVKESSLSPHIKRDPTLFVPLRRQ